MRIAEAIRCYGTSEGVTKSWDSRQRADNQQMLAEQYSKSGKGTRKIYDGVQIYYPTFSESAMMGMNTLAVIAGRNVLSYHDTSSGTKYHYQGASLRGGSIEDAVHWAVGMHVARQSQRQQQKPAYRPVWASAGTLRAMVDTFKRLACSTRLRA